MNEETLCSLMVLNYNGKDLLSEFLPSVLNAADESKYACEVVIVDNQSTDDSLKFIREEYPGVRIIKMDQNLFLISFNKALEIAETPYVILLNNDIRLAPGYIDNMIEHLKKPNVFAVSPKIIGIPGGVLQYAGTFLILRRWWFSMTSNCENAGKATTSIFAHGGASGYNREVFLSLGGFDRRFLPGYAEDLDLSYRAVKRGYRIIYAPSAVAFHRKGATMNKFITKRKVVRISLRNHFIFFWKNITDSRIILIHSLTLPARLTLNLLRGNTDQFISFLFALKHIPHILKCRKELKKNAQYTDIQILRYYQKIYGRQPILHAEENHP